MQWSSQYNLLILEEKFLQTSFSYSVSIANWILSRISLFQNSRSAISTIILILILFFYCLWLISFLISVVLWMVSLSVSVDHKRNLIFFGQIPQMGAHGFLFDFLEVSLSFWVQLSKMASAVGSQNCAIYAWFIIFFHHSCDLDWVIRCFGHPIVNRNICLNDSHTFLRLPIQLFIIIQALSRGKCHSWGLQFRNMIHQR